MTQRLAYLLLAAGGASRFGKCKQLAKIDFKKSLLENALEIALAVAPGEVYLTLGAYREEIIRECQFDMRYPPVHIVISEDWHEGISSSISSAIHHIVDAAYEGVIIQLADQVAIAPEQIKDMRDLSFQYPDKIIAAEYNNILGAPAIFPSHYFDRLINLTGDNGAKWLIKQELSNVLPYSLPAAKWDIDTEQRLNDWQFEVL